MCSHKKGCFKLLFWESYAMWKQISKSPPSCRSRWLYNNDEAHMLKRQSPMKLKQLVRKLTIIASSLSSPCRPLPCCLHVHVRHLLVAHCIHVPRQWPGPPSDWSRKWVCSSVALDKVGQLKSVCPSPKLQHFAPWQLGWASFIFSSLLTSSGLFLDSISVLWQVLHFYQLPGVYGSERHGKTTLSNRTGIPLWQKFDSSKAT